jgi:[protein-PII] uridylyltransferase
MAINGPIELSRDAGSWPEWDAIKRDFFANGDGARVQAALSMAVGETVAAAYQANIEPLFEFRNVLLATGAFARRELFPYSDADLLITYEGAPPAGLNQAVDEFVRVLWSYGIRPSHRICSRREISALREQNFDFSLRLLDFRLLAGDSALASEMERDAAAYAAKNGKKIGQRLISLARERHEKYGNTPSHREPDVKEHPGGLRDLRLLAAIWGLTGASGSDAGALRGAYEFLANVRCFLQFRAGEDCNSLDSAAQDAFIERFAPGASRRGWMRKFFGHAKAVYREMHRALEQPSSEGGSLLSALRDRQSRISSPDFSITHEHLFLREPAALASDPEAIFRLLQFVALHGVAPAPETERRLEAVRQSLAEFCAKSASLWPELQAFLSRPHAAKALRVLEYTGLMTVVFEEWSQIEGALPDDASNPYAIDEHTLIAAERLCALRDVTDSERRRYADLFSGAEDQAVLFFALLYHHMGDGSGDPDPARKAAAIARAAAERLHAPAGDRDLVEFLVAEQESLSGAVSGRDLDDPATVRRLAERIGTSERLRLLAALTYADIAATCPESMLPWRIEQLWQTYVATERELTRELGTDRIHDLPASLPENAEFVKGFPTRYLRSRTAAELEQDVKLYEASRPTGVAVQLERLGGVYKIRIAGRDLPALFASFAGAISSFGLDIVKAEAFSNARGIIFDTFVFADPKDTLELNPPEMERLLDTIRRVASGKTDARRLLRNRAKPDQKARVIEPDVRFDSEACETATLVEITAEDRPGLLYSLATVFAAHACNIDTVLIDTKGRRAIDVFYVARDGEKLPPEFQAILKKELLAACAGER